MTPYETTADARTPTSASSIFSIALGSGCTVTFTNETNASDASRGNGADGRYYRADTNRSADGIHVVLTNTVRTAATEIDRDDAWRRRLELAQLLSAVASESGVAPTAARRSAPLALLVPSYQASLPEGATASEVWRVLARNSQRRIDEAVGARSWRDIASTTYMATRDTE